MAEPPSNTTAPPINMDFRTNPPRMGAVIRGKAPTTSLSYHEDGIHLFAASESDSRLLLIDCQRGRRSDRQPLKCVREGIRSVEATHHNLCVLFVGSGGDKSQPLGHRNAVHYLSLYDNKILRNFRGHAGDVTDLSMSPVDDTFLSSSSDRTVRLWNLQQAGCLAELELPQSVEGTPHVTYDSTGLVFGISAAMSGGGGHMIHLYDARKYDGGPFAELSVTKKSIFEHYNNHHPNKIITQSQRSLLNSSTWTDMQFNRSGKQILISATNGVCLLVDGFVGTINQVFFNPSSSAARGRGMNMGSSTVSACFSPDDKFVLCGNQGDGSIHCWDAMNGGDVVRKLEGHIGPVGAVKSNPKFGQFASSCTNTALWVW